MKKAYAIIVSFIAFFEFSYIMYYGGFTFTPMDRTRAAPVTAAAAPVYTQPTSSYKIGSTRRPTTPPTFPPVAYTPTEEPYHDLILDTSNNTIHWAVCSKAQDALKRNTASRFTHVKASIYIDDFRQCPDCISNIYCTPAPNASRSAGIIVPPSYNSPTNAPVRSVPTAAPEYHQYVANTKTKKFHKPSCSSAKQISYANRAEYYCTREEMIRRGYDPCQRCYP